MQHVRQYLVLVLLALLPLHALLVTVLAAWWQGPHQPIPLLLSSWKELVFAGLLLLAGLEILWNRTKFWRVDWLDVIIFTLIVLAIAVEVLVAQPPFGRAFVYGFKYDFLPLIFFMVLRRVPWSQAFVANLYRLLLVVAVLVAVYALITLFLPASYFTWLGYSDLHSVYHPWKTIAGYQELAGTGLRRLQSTLSGPNQLGLWLLLPLGIWLEQRRHHWRWYAMGLVLGLALVFTWSRAAWLGMGLMVMVAAWQQLRWQKFKQFSVTLASMALLACFMVLMLWPQILLRGTSNMHHIERPLAAWQQMVQNPFGSGLGTAGPATNRTSDPCVYLQAGDNIDWLQDRPELCVFVDNRQITRLADPCTCPFLPENWYLQLGVELGWLGLVLYSSLMILVGYQLILLRVTPVLLSFIGLALAGMFLHAFEDSAIAYTLWVLLAVTFSQGSRFLGK